MGGRDAGTLRVLHDEHAGALWHYVFRLTHDRARAEDIVQETLLRAWRTDLDDDGTGSVRAWLFTVAHRVAIDAYRARSARPQEVGDSVLHAVPTADDIDARLDRLLDRTQHLLFDIGADLAAPGAERRLGPERARELEAVIDRLTQDVEPLRAFMNGDA